MAISSSSSAFCRNRKNSRNSNQQIPRCTVHTVERQRIDRTTVDQHPTVAMHGTENRRDRNGGSHRIVKSAAVEDDLLSGEQVGGNRGKWDPQLPDRNISKFFSMHQIIA